MTRRVAIFAVFAVSAAVPVLTWWVVGDVSEDGAEDIMFGAPELPATVGVIGIVVAVALFVCGLALILTPAGRHHVGRREWEAMLPLLLLGLFVGFGGRVVTARVGGANIGAGLLLFAAPVVVPLLIIWSAVLWRRIGNADGSRSPTHIESNASYTAWDKRFVEKCGRRTEQVWAASGVCRPTPTTTRSATFLITPPSAEPESL